MLIKREIFAELIAHANDKEISLIVGPRQAGKTTIMMEMEEHFKKKGVKTLFLNLDFESDNEHFQSQESLLKKLELEAGREKAYIFIDEIQRKENAGKFLKGLYDMNLPYKFIVSGSGSLELKEKIHESLAGRKRIFELGTVSFREFIDYKTDYKYSAKLPEYFVLEKKQAELFFLEYLNFGGYPRVVLEKRLEEKTKIINEIFRSYIEKDIAYLLGVNRADAFSRMIRLLASQIGQTIQYNKLAAETGISTATVKNYLWYAEKTFSIFLLSPFFKNKHKEITKSPVVYFHDLGMRNFSLGLFGALSQPSQLGFVFQNFVAAGLLRALPGSRQNLRFWRTLDKAEVDFVLNDGPGPLPVEAKYSELKKPRITRSLRNFIKQYKPNEAWVMNLTLDEETKINDTKIIFKPYYK